MAERPRDTEAAVSMARARDQCIRCGRPTQWGRSVCRACNPAGLPEPSPSQYHATALLAIVVVLAVLVVVTMLLR
jgi:hypothetical protein